jgi:hypothetical protein
MTRLASLCVAILFAPSAIAQAYWFTEGPATENSSTIQHILHYRMSAALPARVQAPKVVTLLRPEDGGDLHCEDDAHFVGSFRPWDLMNRLTANVDGKSAKELQAMVQAVQRASGRQQKMQILFRHFSEQGSHHLRLYAAGDPPTPRPNPMNLDMVAAQSRGAVTLDLSRGLTCLTPQQVDGVIAEATRVIGLLIQGLGTGGLAPARQGGSTSTPVLR